MAAKKQYSYRLSDEGRELLQALAAKYSISLTAVLEMAVRKLAQAESISTKSAKVQVKAK